MILLVKIRVKNLAETDAPSKDDSSLKDGVLHDQKLTSEMTVAAAAGTRTEVVVEAHWSRKETGSSE
ncbi:MAG: hypothetical protein V8S93_13785 [Lachnospiraceae bacterium]